MHAAADAVVDMANPVPNVAALSADTAAHLMAPNMAARAEGSAVDMDAVLEFCGAEMARAEADGAQLYIEGVGGVMSPVSDSATNLDWIARLERHKKCAED